MDDVVKRDQIGMAMLAAWLNVRVDQIPPENQAHLNPSTMAAWERVKVAAIRAMLEGLEPVASLYTMHMELNQTCDRLDNPGLAPFGIPGRDYSEEYTVTETPLYDLSALKEAVK